MPHAIKNSGGGGLTGDGPEVTIIQVDYGAGGRPGNNLAHLAAFSFEAQFTIFRDFSLIAVSANDTELGIKPGGTETFPATGIGFRTSSAVSLDMSSLQISGFTWGIWIRYTVMATFRSISIRNCAGGVSLARSEAAFGPNDETSTSGWNAWTGGIDGGCSVLYGSIPLLRSAFQELLFKRFSRSLICFQFGLPGFQFLLLCCQGI